VIGWLLCMAWARMRVELAAARAESGEAARLARLERAGLAHRVVRSSDGTVLGEFRQRGRQCPECVARRDAGVN